MYISKKMVFFFEISAVVALMVSLGIFIASFFMDVHHHGIEIVEGGVVTIFLLEVMVQLGYTKDKKAYLKKNWFYILTILPIIGLLKAFRVGKITHFVKIFQLFQHSKILRSEAMVAKLGTMVPVLLFSKQFISMIYHVLRADFTSVPKALKVVYIDMHISKYASNAAVKGMQSGIRDFFKEEGKQVVFRENREKSVPVDFSVLNTDYERINLYVTHEMVPGFSMMDKKAGILSANLEHESIYEHIPITEFARIRGYTVGFNAFAKKRKPCFCRTCIHKKLDHRRLDLYSFLIHVNKRVPRCEIHT